MAMEPLPRTALPQRPPNLTIRPVEPADYPAIAAIYNESIAQGGITMDCTPYAPENIQAIVQKMTERELILVAVVEQQVIGWGIVKRYSDRLGYQLCCETSIYLTFSKLRRGYGWRLQTALMEQVRAYGYHHIVAKIVAENQSSIHFHQQFEFTIVGVQKEIGFAQGAWRDVVIMQRILPAPVRGT
ncbi:MAG: GNAT family N-acetyltransferase [Elainellaceae cyanobacterium]